MESFHTLSNNVFKKTANLVYPHTAKEWRSTGKTDIAMNTSWKETMEEADDKSWWNGNVRAMEKRDLDGDQFGKQDIRSL